MLSLWPTVGAASRSFTSTAVNVVTKNERTQVTFTANCGMKLSFLLICLICLSQSIVEFAKHLS